MSKWAQITGTNVVGQIVASIRVAGNPIYGLDVNGDGAVYYVNASETSPFELPAAEKSQ